MLGRKEKRMFLIGIVTQRRAGDHRRGGAAQDVDGVRTSPWRTSSSTSPLYGSFFNPNFCHLLMAPYFFSFSFPTRLGSGIRLRRPRQSARPHRHPPTTRPGRNSSGRSSSGRNSSGRSLSNSLWMRNTDCHSRSLQPLQISLVSDDPIKFISDPSKITIEI